MSNEITFEEIAEQWEKAYQKIVNMIYELDTYQNWKHFHMRGSSRKLQSGNNDLSQRRVCNLSDLRSRCKSNFETLHKMGSS